MSYSKSTSISGRLASGKFKCLIPSGHWKINNAIRRGRKSGIIGKMTIEHCIFDNSGNGRGGHDGRWVIDNQDNATRSELFREGYNVKK